MLLAYIIVSLGTHELCLHDVYTDKVYECFPIGHGKQGYETPTGVYEVQEIVKKPFLIDFKTGRSLGYGILGDYSIRLGDNPHTEQGTLAIHGTNDRSSVGKKKSHGCMRSYNEDITEIVENYLFSEVIIKE